MNILILSQYWRPENGVPQRRWAWLTENLVRAGHQVSVVAPPPHYPGGRVHTEWKRMRRRGGNYRNYRRNRSPEVGAAGEVIFRSAFKEHDGTLVSRALTEAITAVGSFGSVWRNVRRGLMSRPDVVIGTVPALPTAVVAAVCARLLGRPLILDLRDAWPDLLAHSAQWNRGVSDNAAPRGDAPRESLRFALRAAVSDLVGGRHRKLKRRLAAPVVRLVLWVTEWALRRAILSAAGVVVTSDDLGKRLKDLGHVRADALVQTVANVFPTAAQLAQTNAVTSASGVGSAGGGRGDATAGGVDGAPSTEAGVNAEAGTSTGTNTGADTKPRALRIIYAGTLGRAQHLNNALEAARIARDRGVDLDIRFVGTGASYSNLRQMVDDLVLPVTFIPRVPAEEIASYYDWADTGLVHLTDWEPLRRAVPSKTFELMEQGLHISAVISGETAEFITRLGAGHVVPPEKPGQLADLWERLYRNPQLLRISPDAKSWVENQRNTVAPQRLLGLLNAVVSAATPQAGKMGSGCD